MAQCKRCFKDDLEWYKVHGKWVLWDADAIQPHNELCKNINQPLPGSTSSYICKHGVLKERCSHGCI